MTELKWCQLLDNVFTARGLDVNKDILAKIVQTSPYATAREQFLSGASDRVIEMQIEMAVSEII